jgi:hypothetical protein
MIKLYWRCRNARLRKAYLASCHPVTLAMDDEL